jgi:hypothetical protein
MFIKDQSLAARNSAGDWRSGNSNDQHLATKKIAILTKRVMVLGPLLIGVNALLIWTLEHTDIIAFTIMLVLSSLIVFALSRLL